MFCKYCGNQIDDDAVFCSSCGKKVADANAQENEQTVNETVQEAATQTNAEAQTQTQSNTTQTDAQQPKQYNDAATAQLFDAVKSRSVDKVKQLIADGANVNIIDADGWTPLMFASYCTLEMVQTLLAAGATIDTKSNVGQTALSLAQYNRTRDKDAIIELLQQYENGNGQFAQEQAKKDEYTEINQRQTTQQATATNTMQSQQMQVLSATQKQFLKNLFADVFKSHTATERLDILKIGLDNKDTQVLQDIKIENIRPWFYSRIFIVLFAMFAIFEFCFFSFGNELVLPAIMIFGSIAIPFSILTLYFELNIYKDISLFKVMFYFGLGGASSFLFTLFLFQIFPLYYEGFNLFGAMCISITEETGKAIIAILLISKIKNSTLLHGLLIGGAVGCGFAVVESAGYAFSNLLNNDIDVMNSVILIRGFLSVGGHTAWNAIIGASYGNEKKINANFRKYFLLCFILHAIWDWDIYFLQSMEWLKLILLCIAAWWGISNLVSKHIEKFSANNTEASPDINVANKTHQQETITQDINTEEQQVQTEKQYQPILQNANEQDTLQNTSTMQDSPTTNFLKGEKNYVL